MSSAVSTAHVVESTDVSAFPAEVIDVKTGVEEPPVAVQATVPFFPAAEKEIIRNVTEKRLLHRVLSRHIVQCSPFWLRNVQMALLSSSKAFSGQQERDLPLVAVIW